MTISLPLTGTRQISPPPAEMPTVPSVAEGRAPIKGLQVTEAAVGHARDKLLKRGSPNAAIRLGVRGGGCSGYSYVIEYDDGEPRERDRVFEFDGVRFFVDKKSLVVLAGSTLEYVKTLMFQGFKFLNPQEASSCGCGHSFTVK